MAKLLTYEQKDTWMDRLCGVTKLIYFLAWSITSMLTYDTRVLAVMLVLSLILFKISKTEWKQVGSIFKFIMFFLVINVLAIFIFANGHCARSAVEGVRTDGVVWHGVDGACDYLW